MKETLNFQHKDSKKENEELVDNKIPKHNSNKKEEFWRFKEDVKDAGENLRKQIESLEEVLENFFIKVIKERPDYIILFDKGMRPFGVPFNSFLDKLKLEKKPKIIFWNNGAQKKLFEEGKDENRAMENLYEQNKHLHSKKIFFVDETFFQGHNAESLRNLFNKKDIDGSYFALSKTLDDVTDEAEKKFVNDKRFVLYDNYVEPALFTKDIASFYVANDKNNNTIRRFQTKQNTEYKKAKRTNFLDKIKSSLFIKEKNIESLVKITINEFLTQVLKAQDNQAKEASEIFSKRISRFVIEQKINLSVDKKELKDEIIRIFMSMVNQPNQGELQEMQESAREIRKDTMEKISKILNNLNLKDYTNIKS